jgi:hypothetical protein
MSADISLRTIISGREPKIMHVPNDTTIEVLVLLMYLSIIRFNITKIYAFSLAQGM